MARAQGARALMALAFETTYGTPPVSGFTRMPFASTSLGAEQPLLNSELLGYGRDPLAPIKDAVTADGDVVVPLDAEAFGFWLKAAFGAPTTTGAEAPYTHEFQSGSWTLPSMSIETGMPEVPRYAMYSGCVLDQITWQMQRSGLLTATARLVAQGETVGTTTSAGTPAALELKRFGHFNGAITRNGTALGNVVSAEITYANNLDRIETIRKTDGGATVPENLNALADSTDMVEALDRLQAMAPAVESVSLVVAWFGDDLRAGSCKVRPGVEVSAKSTTPISWSVNGVSRANAFLVSRDDQDRPVYGGTPADFAVVQAIQEMKARGLRVTFYPFILMDVPPGNTLPNPYSDNAAETGQPAFPWRGRITCSPAAGFAGTVDKTATASTQVAALFGGATPASFSVSGESVNWTGTPGDWGLRRMVLHYAHLCAAADGVDAFLIGTEMPGLTTIRSGASTYPAVQAYRDLLADVRSILGSGTKIGYASGTTRVSYDGKSVDYGSAEDLLARIRTIERAIAGTTRPLPVAGLAGFSRGDR